MLAALLYALNAWRLHPVPASGGSVAGLWFGLAGFVLIVFAGLLPLRKWYPLERLGSAQAWLRAHIWLSLLGSLLILLHSGFRWRGVIEQRLMLLLAALVISGLCGLVAQKYLTRQLTLQVPQETFFENLSLVCRTLQFDGDVLIARLCDEPLPLEPDPAVATDERLKIRGVQGRDYTARLAKIYGTHKAEEKQAEVPAEPPPVEAAAPKAVSAADKIAMMRAKKAAAAPAAAPVATEEPPAAPAAAEAKPMSAADKIAAMRAKKAAAAAPAEAAPAPKPATPAPRPVRPPSDEAWKPFRNDLKNFYLERVRPFLRWERRVSIDGLDGDVTSSITFARMAAELPAELHAPLHTLQALCETRRQYTTQARIYYWLHGWLVFVHIPAAAALLALSLVHIAASLYW
jgi:hypothetical protein